MPENDKPTQETPSASVGKLSMDGVEYALDQLSEEARIQLNNVRMTELELNRLKQQLAITQTARMAYVAALKQALPQA